MSQSGRRRDEWLYYLFMRMKMVADIVADIRLRQWMPASPSVGHVVQEAGDVMMMMNT